MVEPVSPAKTKILVADDEETLLDLLYSALRVARYDVMLAHDGEEALAQVEQYKPDMVLLDVQMPKMDGYEVCRRIKSDVFMRHIPVLMLTARAATRHKVTGLECGADDYVTKPFDMDELMARIRTILRRTRQGLEANPLTRLPGNVAIEKEILSRLKAQSPFAVLFIDINSFKAYNDTYGFVKGDEVIRETARLVLAAAQAEEAFTGHIGGDDFVVICSPEACERLCQDIIRHFNEKSPEFYKPEDRARGYVTCKDRRGKVTQYPLLSISIGAVTNQRRKISSLGEVSAIGAEMKRFAKEHKQIGSAYAIDRRKD
jgi:diguanylate cyclase (GGDEF)-like protein